MEPIGEAVVIAVDSSLSMREKDFKPNRMEAAKQAVAKIVDTLLSRDIPTLASIIAFYLHSYPLTLLTEDYSKLLEASKELRILGEATSPGDAVKDAIFILKDSPPGYSKRMIMVTDGTFNAGVNMEVAGGLAKRSGVTVDVLSFGDLSKYDVESIKKITSITGGIWIHAKDFKELLGGAAEIALRKS